MLNEVKHLTEYHCGSMEMFRYAQHDSAPPAFLQRQNRPYSFGVRPIRKRQTLPPAAMHSTSLIG